MKRKRTGFKMLYIILGIIVLIVGGFAGFLMVGQGVKNAVIQPVDISKVPDGVYNGVYSGGRFGNQMEATVDDGKIVDIKIVKDMVVAIPDLSGKVFTEVKQDQKLDVDVVSGATVSTKAYLKALENAFSGK